MNCGTRVTVTKKPTWTADLVTLIGAVEIAVTATPFLQTPTVCGALELCRRVANC